MSQESEISNEPLQEIEIVKIPDGMEINFLSLPISCDKNLHFIGNATIILTGNFIANPENIIEFLSKSTFDDSVEIIVNTSDIKIKTKVLAWLDDNYNINIDFQTGDDNDNTEWTLIGNVEQ